MTHNKLAVAAVCVSLVLFCFMHTAFSVENKSQNSTQEIKRGNNTKSKCFQGIEFLTGFSWAKLHSKSSYHAVPIFVDLNFNLKQAFPKKLSAYPALLQFVLEPFVNCGWDPKSSMEIGNNFVLKVGLLPEKVRFQPYLKAGLGFMYMTLHTREQSTQLNFNEYGGLGAHYFFNKTTAFTFEYRFRHLSNAGIRKPNHGIDTQFGLCGISLFF